MQTYKSLSVENRKQSERKRNAVWVSGMFFSIDVVVEVCETFCYASWFQDDPQSTCPFDVLERLCRSDRLLMTKEIVHNNSERKYSGRGKERSNQICGHHQLDSFHNNSRDRPFLLEQWKKLNNGTKESLNMSEVIVHSLIIDPPSSPFLSFSLSLTPSMHKRCASSGVWVAIIFSRQLGSSNCKRNEKEIHLSWPAWTNVVKLRSVSWWRCLLKASGQKKISKSSSTHMLAHKTTTRHQMTFALNINNGKVVFVFVSGFSPLQPRLISICAHMKQ